MRKDFKRCTFVFEVRDHDAFKPIWDMLHDLIKIDPDEGVPYRVTAISVDDEIYRAQLYYEAAERYDDHWDLRETMEDIFQCSDVDKWVWPEDREAEVAWPPRPAT